jgi:hypothetical protein
MQRLINGVRGRTGCYVLLGVALWAALILRRLGWRSIAESLWAEDSTIFLNQVYTLGAATLWTPHQGYLHTFQRLFCLAVASFPLAAAPYLLFAGWCLAFAAMVYVLDHRLRRRGFNVAWVVVVIALIGLQPNWGEVYFSITNSQWVLGLALALYVCLPEPDATNPVELTALGVACITGPFSLLLLPVLGAQALIRKDLPVRWRTYLLVTTGALIQLAVLLSSNRLATPVQTGDTFGSWLSALWIFVTFGGRTPLSTGLSVALWMVILAAVLRNLAGRAHQAVWDVLYLFAAASLMFGVSLYSVSLWSSVTSINPLSGGERYFFIPYGLVFTGAAVVFRHGGDAIPRLLTWICAAAMFAICAISFHPERGREDLQWPAFARFASLHRGVEIPINPRWDLSPTFKVIPPPSATIGAATPIPIPLDSSWTGAPQIHFSLAERCTGNRMIGLEAEVLRDKAGYAVVGWGQDANATGAGKQLQRFYPSGLVTLQFAFSRRQGENVVRLVPSVDSAAVLKSLTVYCL